MEQKKYRIVDAGNTIISTNDHDMALKLIEGTSAVIIYNEPGIKEYCDDHGMDYVK